MLGWDTPIFQRFDPHTPSYEPPAIARISPVLDAVRAFVFIRPDNFCLRPYSITILRSRAVGDRPPSANWRLGIWRRMGHHVAADMCSRPLKAADSDAASSTPCREDEPRTAGCHLRMAHSTAGKVPVGFVGTVHTGVQPGFDSGPWCKGSTLVFGTSSPSSNLGGPVQTPAGSTPLLHPTTDVRPPTSSRCNHPCRRQRCAHAERSAKGAS